ncbi:MAG: hypothetical protein RR194_03995 [Ruthenibacterium sp.]
MWCCFATDFNLFLLSLADQIKKNSSFLPFMLYYKQICIPLCCVNNRLEHPCFPLFPLAEQQRALMLKPQAEQQRALMLKPQAGQQRALMLKPQAGQRAERNQLETIDFQPWSFPYVHP